MTHLQDILSREFMKFGTRPISVVETGTLRSESEASRIGDGWSTIYFAARAQKLGGRVVSIDLDTRCAKEILKRRGLDAYCAVVQEHSIAALSRMCRAQELFDVVFLDSDNDGQLIFHEYLIAQLLVRPGGLILVDDVRMPHHNDGEPALAKKGSVLLPHLLATHAAHRLHERFGWNGYRTGVLAIDR